MMYRYITSLLDSEEKLPVPPGLEDPGKEGL